MSVVRAGPVALVVSADLAALAVELRNLNGSIIHRIAEVPRTETAEQRISLAALHAATRCPVARLARNGR